MARVWEASSHGGTELLALLAIADFADDDGNAYPSVGTLAKKCRLQPRRMNYILSSLQGSGELDMKLSGGPRGTNRYRITLMREPLHSSAGVQPSAGVHSNAGNPCTPVREPLHSSAPKPSVTINNHQKVDQSIRSLLSEIPDDLFADFAKLKKTKKSAITKTAIDGIRREAAKAEISFEDAIRTCCERNWQGFKAEWLSNSNSRTPSGNDKQQAKPWEGAR